MTKREGRLLFLGTGSSTGIPAIGCRCSVCTSEDPHNCRSRSAALWSVGGKRFLVDVSPDFRSQALRFGIDTIDGVLFTHTHYDHCGGVDDLRVYYFHNQCTPVPCLISRSGKEELQKLFYYMIPAGDHCADNAGRLDLHVLEGDAGRLDFLGVEISYFSYQQRDMTVYGYRIGDCAYVTDIRDYDESIFEHLQGVRQLVVSALRFTASLMHFSVDEAIDFSRRVGAEKTWLIHISHDLDHQKTNSYLPPGIEMAYDGLEIKL